MEAVWQRRAGAEGRPGEEALWGEGRMAPRGWWRGVKEPNPCHPVRSQWQDLPEIQDPETQEAEIKVVS